MSDLSSAEGRAEARELCERATDGPWQVEHIGQGNYEVAVPRSGDLHATPPDLAFIAFARTLLPEALDLLDRAEEENERLRSEWDNLNGLRLDEKELRVRAESALSRARDALIDIAELVDEGPCRDELHAEVYELTRAALEAFTETSDGH